MDIEATPDLWVRARRGRDGAYLLTDGKVAYITYKAGPQGSTPLRGPFPLASIEPRGWTLFQVALPFTGPLRALSRQELTARLRGR